MRFPGFIGPSYTLRSVNYDCQRTMNMYPEIDELRTGKEGEVASLIGTPGLVLLATIGTGPIRGVWNTTTGAFYVVSGNTLYIVSSSWVASAVGTLSTTTGPVSIADNGLQLVIVDGPNGYYVDFTGQVFTKITDPNFLGADVVTFQDGYFIFKRPFSQQFYLSDLNAITFTAPALTAKNGYPDSLVSIININRNLWLFGDVTTEVWFNSGNALNPFQYIAGTLQQYGCAAAFSVTKIGNTVCWLGKDQTGSGIVFMANGYAPQRVSTQAVELAIQSYSTISDAIGFSYQEGGHQFYFLSFPTGNATWVYDMTTQMWHERAYTSQGQFQRHRANCYAQVFGSVHVVGDYANGNIYRLDSNVFTDNGAAITRQRVTPHISTGMNRVFCSELQLDFESGTGTDGVGQGTNPQAILQWSNDGGRNWSNEHWSFLCPIGSTSERAIWRRLGQGRNRVYKLTITDPIKVVLIGAEIDLMAGAS